MHYVSLIVVDKFFGRIAHPFLVVDQSSVDGPMDNTNGEGISLEL
jgi:hypothetical protein